MKWLRCSSYHTLQYKTIYKWERFTAIYIYSHVNATKSIKEQLTIDKYQVEKVQSIILFSIWWHFFSICHWVQECTSGGFMVKRFAWGHLKSWWSSVCIVHILLYILILLGESLTILLLKLVWFCLSVHSVHSLSMNM